ncbi:sugar phosphate isomerase/epimerase family protein [Paenibacillus thermotolerans]|uniref:sugar phosphate isomerase/epimerase family protein n=1 Tax=Paenibacillus thermotolerans TaxID=3027807 RepID=UPI002368A00D|nr:MULTISPECIES: sugar phosphate isomerase/epimerase family protein [unclassified Paenibacillus]
MLRGLTRAGIGDVGPIDRFVQLASSYGFESVDAGANELRDWISRDGRSNVQQYLKEHNVVIGSIGFPVEWRDTEERFRHGLAQLGRDAETAAELGISVCCTYVLPSTDWNAARFMAVATRRLRACAVVLNSYGIRFGLEFVGPHHLRTAWKNPFIWDADSHLEWIEAIGEPNVGLLYDAYHWYTNGLTKDDILKLRADQIAYVHINDAKDVPVEEALDNDRVYPGEGVIDLTSFLQGLKEIGYKGPISQEILTRTPPEQTPAELLERSRKAFDKVFGEAFGG